MSDTFSVRAPGKLVLVGEYAVLDDVPAVALAIDRGVSCDVVLGGAEVRISTPDGDARFVAPALTHAAPGHYAFGSWNPVYLPGKPGFGGSAAACVAACVAGGRRPQAALHIHHTVQGSGSGIDVLASIHGGMGRVEQQQWHALPPVEPVVVYAGSSAKTGPRVDAYRRWGGPQKAAFLRESATLADQLIVDPIAAFARAWRLLTTMADHADIAYRTPALNHIVSLAENAGGAAKPSGAGGGDCAVAVFPTPDARARFIADCEVAHHPVIVVSAASGARRQA